MGGYQTFKIVIALNLFLILFLQSCQFFILYIEDYSIMGNRLQIIKPNSLYLTPRLITLLNIGLKDGPNFTQNRVQVCLLIIIKQWQMQECLKRFVKRRASQKWTSQEKEQLRQTVIQIEPKENEGWRQVCLKMHELGSRRTQQDYKNRGIIFLQYKEKKQIKFNNDDLDQICTQFQDGMSVKCLTKKYAYMFENPVRLRNRLIQRFQSIRCSIRRIVGLSNTRPIKIQDYELFAFIKSRGFSVMPLSKVAQLSRRHKVIKKPKTQEQKQQIEQIERQLSQFNKSLWEYTKMFHQSKQHQPKNIKQQKGKMYSQRSATVPFRHLAQITKAFNEMKSSQITSESDNSFLNEGEQLKLWQTNITNISTLHTFRQEDEWQKNRLNANYFNFGFCSIDQQCDSQIFQNCDDSYYLRQTGI